jgi:CRISPR-associated protein Csb2
MFSCSAGVDTVQYVLSGAPLPRVEETLRIGELFRQAVMANAAEVFGQAAIPPLLSGHDLPATQRHQHAFYLPWDSDGDGRIDRLLLHVPAGLGEPEQIAAGRLQRLWSREGARWTVTVDRIGTPEGVGGLCGRSAVWQSVTPYLHPWHRKKGFGVAEQVQRECRARGLREPLVVERLSTIAGGGGRPLRSVDFERVRSKLRVAQPDKNGSFLRLTFAETIHGPVALGFGCHFGLGLCDAANTETRSLSLS